MNFPICRFHNRTMTQVGNTILEAPRLLTNGILVSEYADSNNLPQLREVLPLTRQELPLLTAEDIAAATVLSSSLQGQKIGTENTWYELLPELLALEMTQLSAFCEDVLYLELLEDDSLVVHLVCTAETNAELILHYPNNHGLTGDTGLEAAWVTDKMVPIPLPTSLDTAKYAVQTAACLYRLLRKDLSTHLLEVPSLEGLTALHDGSTETVSALPVMQVRFEGQTDADIPTLEATPPTTQTIFETQSEEVMIEGVSSSASSDCWW